MDSPKFSFRQSITIRPRAPRHGDVSFMLAKNLVHNFREEALSIGLISRRQLFGYVYSRLQPRYFYEMPRKSGVFIKPLVKTEDIIPGAIRPGDIDLLVIPYEGPQLILERTLAIEIKAIRASFDRQGKSPNDFGYSQAAGLLKLGFPFVAIVHLVVSDQSPESAWRNIKAATILDEEGRVGQIEDIRADMLPSDLIDRGYGRLSKNCLTPEIGLACAYVGEYNQIASDVSEDRGYWIPRGRAATFNECTSITTLQSVEQYFNTHVSTFLDNPRYDP